LFTPHRHRPAPSDAYKFYVEYSTDAATGAGAAAAAWLPIPELDMRTNTRDRPHAYFELATPLTGVKQMRITNVHMPANATFSVSGFRVFGMGCGAVPDAAGAVVAVRNTTDPRRVGVSWAASKGTDFYIVRYGVLVGAGAGAGADADATGTHPHTHSEGESTNNALPYNYQIYNGTAADIRSLVAGVKYTFVVDAVNENGVTVGKGNTVVV
jgi:hypothetical protein